MTRILDKLVIKSGYSLPDQEPNENDWEGMAKKKAYLALALAVVKFKMKPMESRTCLLEAMIGAYFHDFITMDELFEPGVFTEQEIRTSYPLLLPPTQKPEEAFLAECHRLGGVSDSPTPIKPSCEEVLNQAIRVINFWDRTGYKKEDPDGRYDYQEELAKFHKLKKQLKESC